MLAELTYAISGSSGNRKCACVYKSQCIFNVCEMYLFIDLLFIARSVSNNANIYIYIYIYIFFMVRFVVIS